MSEPQQPLPAAKASRWPYRMLYGSVMAGFAALLVWTGSGPPATRAAFETLVRRSLPRYVPGLRCEQIAEGVLLATGERVFEVVELAEADWKAHAEGGDGRDQKLALAADPEPGKRLAALPVPLAHFHETLGQSLAARHLAIQRVGDVPAYLFFRDAQGLWRPVTRGLAESGALGPSEPALFEAALANASAAEWSLGADGALKMAADSPMPALALLLAPGFEAKARERLGAERFQIGARSPWSVRLFAGEAEAFEPFAQGETPWPDAIAFAFRDGKLAYLKRL
jgi:hypothetical protein